jgi:hypothetical protein
MVTDPRDPDAGSVEFVDSLNLTTTPDSCVEKIAPLVPALATGAAITDLSAGSRLFFGDGTNVKEWPSGTTIANRFSSLSGPVAHTPLDARVSDGDVYKSVNGTSTMGLAAVGTYSGPAISKPFSSMPAFNQAFVYNGKLYAINAADPRFLQYSEDYAYDLWALGDNFIGSMLPLLQAGSIPGVLLTADAGGVTAYIGPGPHDFNRKRYGCAFIDKTLYSGFVSKIYGYSHIFLCDDGVYVVGQDGALANLTVDQTDHVDVLNNVYYCSTVQNGKYLAFGDLCCLEYDFKTKTLLKRSPFSVVGACVWNGVNYFASGQNICTMGTEIDTGALFGCSLTLPYSDLSAPGKKSFEALYFTGTINGDWIITITDQNQESWALERSDELVNVSNYRIKTPKRFLGNHVQVKIECTSGAFRMEELRAVFSASQRSK